MKAKYARKKIRFKAMEGVHEFNALLRSSLLDSPILKYPEWFVLGQDVAEAMGEVFDPLDAVGNQVNFTLFERSIVRGRKP
jgi:hypothetical protein